MLDTPQHSILTSGPSGPLKGTLSVPGDKSISHRSIILGSLAEGETHVSHLLEGEDVLCTVAAFQAMGVEITIDDTGIYHIQGVGLDGLNEPKDVLNMGNSGTAMRLLAGVLASQPFLSILNGDASLRSRPMRRITTPLLKMGARILTREGGLAPLVIRGTELLPITYESPVASAQVKSAILLAGLNTAGETTVIEPSITRDHSERMLTSFGAELERDGRTITLDGWPTLTGQTIQVPGDISSAAFPMVAALLIPGSELLLTGVGINPTRTGLLDLLLEMGGNIQLLNARDQGGEPVADLKIHYAPLKGITVPPDVIPRAIDEFPIFFAAACMAEGETIVAGAKELRVKESDRISSMAQGLLKIGAILQETEDGMVITGQPDGLNGGVHVDSFTDHRIAMSLLVAGMACRKPVTVNRCTNINTSFPGFYSAMQQLGGQISIGPNSL